MSDEYKRCIDLRANINELNNILDLTDRAPGILDRLNRGEKFPEDSKELAKRVGVDLNDDGTPTHNTRVDLQGFIDAKEDNLEEKKNEEVELENLIKEKNYPRQDSSEVSGDTEPMDFMDPDA